MAGRPRLPISAFGAIKTVKLAPGRFRASTRFRDWDGQTRQVSATGSSSTNASTALKVDLAGRMRVGDDALSADSPFPSLAAAWVEYLLLDCDRADSTKEIYQRELRSLELPFFSSFTVREVTGVVLAPKSDGADEWPDSDRLALRTSSTTNRTH
jgi:hypothetical protein